MSSKNNKKQIETILSFIKTISIFDCVFDRLFDLVGVSRTVRYIFKYMVVVIKL